MSNRKASAFTVLSNLVDSTYFALAQSGTNYRLQALKIWEYIQAKQKGPASNITTGGTIALADNDYVISLVATNSGGPDVTFDVGTTASGTEILEAETVTAGTTETYVINHFQAAAANIHFTLDTGSLSVRAVKI